MENTDIMFTEIEYQEKKGVIKNQWWYASIPHEYIALRDCINYSYSIDKRRIDAVLAEYDKIRLEQIIWIPIIEKSIEAESSREFHSGYCDNQAIIYRGERLYELKASSVVNQYPHFASTIHNSPLSDGARSKLREWFLEELREATSPELLQFLIKRGKNNFLNYLQRDVTKLISSLSEFSEIVKGIKI